jgi:hypothetical protein
MVGESSERITNPLPGDDRNRRKNSGNSQKLPNLSNPSNNFGA